MADSPVSVRGAVAFSWSLWSAHWRSIWGVLALSSLAGTVATAGSLVDNQPLKFVGLGASVIISLMSNGAIFRLAFADRHVGDPAFAPGPSGLQWRALEWRLLGATGLLIAFEMIIAVLLLIAVGAVAAGLMLSHGGLARPPQTPEAIVAALGPAGGAVVSLLAIVGYGAFLFVAIRLGLTTAATADEGRIQVLSTWRLTRGQFWRMVGSLFVIIAPLTLFSMVVGATNVSMQGGVATTVQLSPSAALVSGLLMGVLSGGVMQPLIAGVLAYFYRKLKAPGSGAAV